jgi:hypothetical protein
MRNLLAQAGQERGVPWPLGRPCTVATKVSGPEISGSKHWPTLPHSYAVTCVWPRGVTGLFLVKFCKCNEKLL